MDEMNLNAARGEFLANTSFLKPFLEQTSIHTPFRSLALGSHRHIVIKIKNRIRPFLFSNTIKAGSNFSSGILLKFTSHFTPLSALTTSRYFLFSLYVESASLDKKWRWIYECFTYIPNFFLVKRTNVKISLSWPKGYANCRTIISHFISNVISLPVCVRQTFSFQLMNQFILISSTWKLVLSPKWWSTKPLLHFECLLFEIVPKASCFNRGLLNCSPALCSLSSSLMSSFERNDTHSERVHVCSFRSFTAIFLTEFTVGQKKKVIFSNVWAVIDHNNMSRFSIEPLAK